MLRYRPALRAGLAAVEDPKITNDSGTDVVEAAWRRLLDSDRVSAELVERQAILPALHRSKLVSAEQIKYWPIDAAGAAGALEFFAAELRWLQEVLPDLERAL
jgi:hypothetical protein